MTLARQAISSFRWLLAGRLTAQLVSWSITIVVIRLLAPEDYGLLAMAMLFIALFVLINDLGVGAALVQSEELSETSLRQAHAIVLALNGVLFAIVYVGAPLVASFFEEAKLVEVLRVLAVQLPLSGLCVVPIALLRRRMQFRRKALLDFLGALTGSFVTLALALQGAGVWALVLGQLATQLTLAVSTTFATSFWVLPRLSFGGMDRLMRFGGLLTGNQILWFLYSQADVFLIGKLLGKESLGIYSVARTIASLPMEKVMSTLNEVGFASFARLQSQPELFQRYFVKLTRILAFLAFPVFFGIASVAPELVTALLADKWNATILPLQLIALIIPLRMLSNMTAPAVFARGRADVPTATLAIACVIMPTAFAIGSQWGVGGVAWAWVVAFPVQFGIVLNRTLPVLGIPLREYLSALRDPLLAAAFMYGMVTAGRAAMAGYAVHPGAALALLVTLGAVTFAAAMWVLRRECYSEAFALLKS